MLCPCLHKMDGWGSVVYIQIHTACTHKKNQSFTILKAGENNMLTSVSIHAYLAIRIAWAEEEERWIGYYEGGWIRTEWI